MNIYFEQQKGITEKWIVRCNLKFNNKFDYSKVDFTVGANVKQTIICPEHGEFKTTKRNHYESKYGCTQCGKVLMLIESVNNWKAKCSEKFNNKFDYSKVELTNAETKVTIICPIHGEFKATRSTHYDSVTGCYKCGKLKSDSDERMEEFINKVESKFDIKIINCNYKTGTDSPTTSKCNVCRKISEWSCATAVTNSPRGCRYCVDSDKLEIKMKQIVTNWKQYCTNKFNNKFDYSKVPDICSETDLIIIICPIHGEFQTTRNSHKYDSAYGCAQCSNAVIGSKVSIALTGQSRNANQINAHNKQMIDSINNWKVKCLEKFDNRFDYSKVEFINAENKITIICPDHGEFKIRRDQHLASKYGGCPKCRYNLVDNSENIEKLMNDWIARCNLKFNNKFDYSKVKYESHSDKVTIICPEHGEFVVGRNTHETSKSGCKLCSGRLSDKPLEERKLETIKAIESKFDIQVLSCDYIDSNDSKTVTRCGVCNSDSEWNSTTLVMASRLGCKTCLEAENIQKMADRLEASHNQWVVECNEKFNNKFDYSKAKVVGMGEFVDIICPDHGLFSQTKQVHKESVFGCGKCSGQMITTEDFISTASEIYGDQFTYNNTEYVTSNDKLIVTCKNHGDILVLPSAFTNMHEGRYLGCTYCNRQNMFDSGKIYTFKIKDKNLWKVGVTKHDVSVRFYRELDLIDESTIKEFQLNNIFEAYKIESQILHQFKDHRNNKDSIFKLNAGNTELLSIDPVDAISLAVKGLSSQISHNVSNNFAMLKSEINNMSECEIQDLSHEGFNILLVSGVLINYVIPKQSLDSINSHKLIEIKYMRYNYSVITLYDSNNIDINLSIIRNALQLNTTKIYARKCEVRVIDYAEAKDFLELYHIQGSRNTNISIGLFYDNELVQVMTLGKPLFTRLSNCIEIYRLASKTNLTVVGGASKLLKYFERNLSTGYDNIITYADGAISKGEVYNKLGFGFLKKSESGYFYVNLNSKTKLSRYQCSKANIKKSFDSNSQEIKYFNDSETEAVNMYKNGFIKIVTPKQLSFIKEIKRSN